MTRQILSPCSQSGRTSGNTTAAVKSVVSSGNERMKSIRTAARNDRTGRRERRRSASARPIGMPISTTEAKRKSVSASPPHCSVVTCRRPSRLPSMRR